MKSRLVKSVGAYLPHGLATRRVARKARYSARAALLSRARVCVCARDLCSPQLSLNLRGAFITPRSMARVPRPETAAEVCPNSRYPGVTYPEFTYVTACSPAALSCHFKFQGKTGGVCGIMRSFSMHFDRKKKTVLISKIT